MNKKQQRSLLLIIGSALFGCAVAAYLIARFFMSGPGEIFHWLSFDGIDTWGTRKDIIPLAVFSLLTTVVGAVASAVCWRKQKINSSYTLSILSLILAFLFLLAGLRFQ